MRSLPTPSFHLIFKKFLNQNASRFLRSREDDLRFGGAEGLKLADKMIELFGTVKGDLYYHRIIPRDTATFNHVWMSADIGVKLGLLGGGDLKIYKGDYRETELFIIKFYRISAYNSVLLQLFDSSGGGRGGEIYAFSKLL